MLSFNLVRRATNAATSASRRYLRTAVPLFTTPLGGNSSDSNSSGVLHTTDTYAKDVDTSPAVDHQIYRVDASSENVQKPYEAPSGEWSRAGVKTSEYTNVNKTDQPYAPKEPEGQRQRYGGRKNWPDDKGPETSHPGEGPTGTDAGGRKPERR